MAARIPSDDLRDPDPFRAWMVFMPAIIFASVLWPVAALLEVLHLLGAVRQQAAETVALIPLMPAVFMPFMVGWMLLLCEGLPAAWRALGRAWQSDVVRTRRVRRRVRRSRRPGDLLTYWHRAHQAALETGCEPPEAVRRADAAVLRP